jgi:hypothetical protein
MKFLRSTFVVFIIFAAVALTSCEAADATPTPRPTRTVTPTSVRPPTDTPTPEPTPTLILEPTEAPTYTPVPANRAGAPQPVPSVSVSIVGSNDPLLPKMGPYPPKPIPARPAGMNPLTGLTVPDASVLQRRPIVARIGNDKIVRDSVWHAGLDQADIVFEELIDILGNAYAHTRYSAVFLTNTPPLIGPIRSGRIINFQVVPMLDAAFAHAGASNGTRWLFSQVPTMINLDEYFNQPAYCYDKTHGYQGRLYTTAPRIHEWLTQKGLEKPVPLYGFSFGDKPGASQAANALSINRPPWPSWSTVDWKYDAASGTYLRFTTGSPHMVVTKQVTAKWGNGADCVSQGAETRQQVRSTNVVVLWARHEKTNIIEDSNNAVSVFISLVGQGDAQIFRDGVTIKGKWQRKSEQEFFQFVDSAGNTIPLKPGTTWFEIVPTGYIVDVK